MAIKLEFATEGKEPARSLLESATFFPRSTRLRGFFYQAGGGKGKTSRIPRRFVIRAALDRPFSRALRIRIYASYGFIELGDYHKRAFARNNVNYEVITGLLKTFERKGIIDRPSIILFKRI